jgi:hypothetical protein
MRSEQQLLIVLQLSSLISTIIHLPALNSANVANRKKTRKLDNGYKNFKKSFFYSLLNSLSAYNWASGSNGNVMWASGCDFYGNDISNVASEGADCGCHCASNPNCDHFTWYYNVCYLKKAIDPPTTDLPGSVCGWVTARTYCPGINQIPFV